MTPEEKLIERLLLKIDKINTELIEVIGASLKRIGKLKPTQVYQIQQELKYGKSLQEIVSIIEKISDISQKEIIDVLETVAKKDQDFRRVYYEARKKDFIPYSENKPLQNIVREIGMQTLATYKNISRTAGLTYLDSVGNRITKPMIQAYWDIVDDAVLKASTGQMTFNQVLKDQIKTFAGSGIQSIEYESGYHRRIDSALKMNMEEALMQMTIKQNEIVGEQFDYDAMEVSVHAYPAPDHEDIQGHIFDLDNWKKLQDYTYIGEIKDVKGKVYIRDGGNPIRAIATLNCKHIGYSTIKEAKPRYTDEQLEKIKKNNKEGFELDGKHYTLYEGTQLQRKLEQRIRDEKHIQVGARASGDNDLAQESQSKINKLTNKYSELSKKSGLPSYTERLSASGYRKIKTKPLNYEEIEYARKNNAIWHTTENLEEIINDNNIVAPSIAVGKNITTKVKYGSQYIEFKPEILENVDKNAILYKGDGGNKYSRKGEQFNNLMAMLKNSPEYYNELKFNDDIESLKYIKRVYVRQDEPKKVLELLEKNNIEYKIYNDYTIRRKKKINK